MIDLRHQAHEVDRLERGRRLTDDEIACYLADHQTPLRHGTARVGDEIAEQLRDRLADVNAAVTARAHVIAEPHRYELACVVCGQLGQIRVSVDPQEAASALDPDPRYAYLRDGSVLGRVTGWRGGVPIIDTTDRHPGPDIADLAGPPPGSPSEDVGARIEASDGEAVPRTRGIEPATTPDLAHRAAVGASPSSPDPVVAPLGDGRRPDRP